MMHKNVAYNGLRFFVVIRVGGEGVVETRSAMCMEPHRSEGIFLYKNTPSMRAAKIIKNNEVVF